MRRWQQLLVCNNLSSKRERKRTDQEQEVIWRHLSLFAVLCEHFHNSLLKRERYSCFQWLCEGFEPPVGATTGCRLMCWHIQPSDEYDSKWRAEPFSRDWPAAHLCGGAACLSRGSGLYHHRPAWLGLRLGLGLELGLPRGSGLYHHRLVLCPTPTPTPPPTPTPTPTPTPIPLPLLLPLTNP